MLKAEKEQLNADTAVAVISLRDKELRYYSSQIENIATMSTLLVGFAFSIFAYSTDDSLTHSGFDNFWRNYKEFDGWVWYEIVTNLIRLFLITVRVAAAPRGLAAPSCGLQLRCRV